MGPPGFGPDDDTLFQVANLLLLEEQGFDISSQDVADNWLARFSAFEASNTGDVGPVMGIVLGRSAIAEKWTAPIANIMRTDVRGAEELLIDDLARRTVEIGEMMTAAKSAGRVEITD